MEEHLLERYRQSISANEPWNPGPTNRDIAEEDHPDRAQPGYRRNDRSAQMAPTQGYSTSGRVTGET